MRRQLGWFAIMFCCSIPQLTLRQHPIAIPRKNLSARNIISGLTAFRLTEDDAAIQHRKGRSLKGRLLHLTFVTEITRKIQRGWLAKLWNCATAAFQFSMRFVSAFSEGTPSPA
ncbi:hypothetical protein SY94_5395 (plasmid) [Agrobacterium tumefaciens]|nr:hypothetical protein SY94_5395 [Agrobacterium tumefaciens]